MTDILSKVLALRDDLQANLLEREAAIDAAILALVTREHALFLGPPGTAKSMLVRAVCDRIEGAGYFERLVTKFSTPEELFGPLSLSALENDVMAELRFRLRKLEAASQRRVMRTYGARYTYLKGEPADADEPAAKAAEKVV
ncbi:MAG TPA: AAA family ATPase [Polyangia bacterium]|nr:AAA family ATPase [Polyangia bacterium]